MKIFLTFLTCIIIIACNKNRTPKTILISKGSIRYKVDGALFTVNNDSLPNGQGVVFAKQLKGTLSKTRYSLNAKKGSDNVLGFTLITDSLQTINYHYDSSIVYDNTPLYFFDLGFNGRLGALFFSGDYMDVSISSYFNGRISGTFTAKLSPLSRGGAADYSQKGRLLITEGVINNVPVNY